MITKDSLLKAIALLMERLPNMKFTASTPGSFQRKRHSTVSMQCVQILKMMPLQSSGLTGGAGKSKSLSGLSSEFKARPVYLTRDDRITAHFMTCFTALLIYRLFEKKLNDKYTCHEIINGLRGMNFLEIKGEGYVPAYTRTDFTDDLHEVFGFRTDYQIVSTRQMKNIFKITKS
jgi:hypothetical protein